jgi:uncharacterized protein (TIGR03435 family)
MNAPVIHAQSQVAAPTPKFEVASIKPCGNTPTGSGVRSGSIGVSPGRLRVTCASVTFMIQTAYVNSANVDAKLAFRIDPNGLAPVSGGPPWMKSDPFAIEAKAEGNPSAQMMQGPMLQALLEDRFKLKIHRETREIPVYVLTVAKSGVKLRPLEEGACTPSDPFQLPAPTDKNFAEAIFKTCGTARITRTAGGMVATAFHGMSLDQASRELTRRLDRPVINRTGIPGLFDLHLEFSPDQATPGFPASDDPPGGPSIFTALQEQLGLKLEPAKGPGEFLVVDSVERPSEN